MGRCCENCSGWHLFCLLLLLLWFFLPCHASVCHNSHLNFFFFFLNLFYLFSISTFLFGFSNICSVLNSTNIFFWTLLTAYKHAGIILMKSMEVLNQLSLKKLVLGLRCGFIRYFMLLLVHFFQSKLFHYTLIILLLVLHYQITL
jgi:hypothetical protein